MQGVLEGLVNEDELEYGQWLYTDFQPAKKGAIEIDLSDCPSLQAIIRYLIRNYFKGIAEIKQAELKYPFNG